MTLTPSPPQTETTAAYFALDVASDLRHEYRNGEIIPMTGGTPAHNEISANLVFLLKGALRKQPYSIFVADQRLWIPEPDDYAYPDVMVTPRPAALKPGRRDTVLNPIVLAEVLSGSTEKYDRGNKFQAYRTIPTFQDYLLIAQEKPQVEQYIKKGENQWLLMEHRGLSAVFTLQSLGISLSLADLYEAIEF